MTKAVVKLFQDPAIAARAIQELIASGVEPGDIGVAVKTEEASAVISRSAGVTLTTSGGIALSGPAASSNSLDGLAEIWGVAKEGMFYYESGLQRGGVIISVHTGEAGAQAARAALRAADSSHIVAIDPPLNDRPFYLSERVTKSDMRDKQFSGDFRKY